MNVYKLTINTCQCFLKTVSPASGEESIKFMSATVV